VDVVWAKVDEENAGDYWWLEARLKIIKCGRLVLHCVFSPRQIILFF
jgi:hypothetical protein